MVSVGGLCRRQFHCRAVSVVAWFCAHCQHQRKALVLSWVSDIEVLTWLYQCQQPTSTRCFIGPLLRTSVFPHRRSVSVAKSLSSMFKALGSVPGTTKSISHQPINQSIHPPIMESLRGRERKANMKIKPDSAGPCNLSIGRWRQKLEVSLRDTASPRQLGGA